MISIDKSEGELKWEIEISKINFLTKQNFVLVTFPTEYKLELHPVR